jgi:hypothetical protein
MILNFHKFTLHNAMRYSQPRLAHHFLQYNAVLSGGVYLGKMVSETWRHRPHDWGSSLKIILFGALGVYHGIPNKRHQWGIVIGFTSLNA